MLTLAVNFFPLRNVLINPLVRAHIIKQLLLAVSRIAVMSLAVVIRGSIVDSLSKFIKRVVLGFGTTLSVAFNLDGKIFAYLCLLFLIISFLLLTFIKFNFDLT